MFYQKFQHVFSTDDRTELSPQGATRAARKVLRLPAVYEIFLQDKRKNKKRK